MAATAGLALVAGGGPSALAQGAAGDDKFVTKEEFQKLRQENEQLRKDLQELRQMIKPAGQMPTATAPGAEISAVEQIARAGDLKEAARYTFPGSTRSLLTGYGSAGFSALRNSDAAFNAQFNPIFLWKITDKLLFEGEAEFELDSEDNSTEVALELANLSYVANDYVTFQAGKFLNPMNSFVERYHMAWVNRLPDTPLAVYDGLLAETYVGAQFRGGIPLGPTKINYAAFLANAPSLQNGVAADTLGALDFDNFGNGGGHIAVGGHVGFQPVPECEFGYGIHSSGVKEMHEDVLLQSVDFNYVRDSELLRGLLRLNAQWTWSHLGSGDYVDDVGGVFPFENNRDGGYAQITYRPTKCDLEVVKHLEGVFRFDMLNQKDTPVGYDQSRYTAGLNYWLTPKTVFKAAYQWDTKSRAAGVDAPNQSGVYVQFATGF